LASFWFLFGRQRPNKVPKPTLPVGETGGLNPQTGPFFFGRVTAWAAVFAKKKQKKDPGKGKARVRSKKKAERQVY
jgi:hypothetical protein